MKEHDVGPDILSDFDLEQIPEINLFSGNMQAPSKYTANFRAHLAELGLDFNFTETECAHDIFCFMTPERIRSVYGTPR